jgi:hypothetical protein
MARAVPSIASHQLAVVVGPRVVLQAILEAVAVLVVGVPLSLVAVLEYLGKGSGVVMVVTTLTQAISGLAAAAVRVRSVKADI